MATFDLGPDVLRAVRAHQLLFAVDQQAYLQGYLPIVLLTERARYGLFPAQGDVLPTGPNFVTAAQRGQGDRAEQALDPLAARLQGGLHVSIITSVTALASAPARRQLPPRRPGCCASTTSPMSWRGCATA